ncbi:TrkH family potassium uptake protein [Minwuia thermotolerans]|uniref:TrkH family potassium uptake protein n=1 Tax=Minwuia thermotolerans TaxID=2056226 RepID=UPI0019D07FC3|nr:TrkH family potassium uptake protein [Minwuia thermotolerans]
MLNLQSIFYIVGMLWCGLAGLMLVPILIDLVTIDGFAVGFLESMLVVLALGGLLVIASRPRQGISLRLRDAFVLTSLAWASLPAAAALPFLFYGLDYSDAYFEAMSGLTTTGSTVIAGLDTADRGLLFWRSLLQWMGGAGIILMAIMLLPFLRVGGMQLFRTESSDQFEKAVPRAVQFGAWIFSVYAGLTVIAALTYKILGMSDFDAICHAMTTLSTGGYSTHDASFGYFEEPALHWAASLFMIAGALPFAAYVHALRGRPDAFYKDPQVRGFLAVVFGVCALFTLWLWLTEGGDPTVAARLVVFNVVSIVTTTGYATTDYQLWGSFAVTAFLFLMFMGGCAGSTSGAVKTYRIQILAITVVGQIRRLSSVHRVHVPQYGGQRLPADVPVSVLAFLAAYVVVIAFGSLLLSMTGLDMVTSVTATITALTNVGPGLGSIIGPAGNFVPLSDTAKWLLSAAMMLGRLELFTVLVLLDPEFWRN